MIMATPVTAIDPAASLVTIARTTTVSTPTQKINIERSFLVLSGFLSALRGVPFVALDGRPHSLCHAAYCHSGLIRINILW